VVFWWKNYSIAGFVLIKKVVVDYGNDHESNAYRNNDS
jgi:hypothetical protein